MLIEAPKTSTLKVLFASGKALTPGTVAAPGKVAAPALAGIMGLPVPGLAAGPSMQIQQTEELTAALQAQYEAVNILSSSFTALFDSTGDGFQNMIDTMIAGLKRLIAEYLAKAAVLTLLRILFPVTLGVGATTELMKMGLFAKGASGGTVPSGYPHDTFPAMLSSGETVLTARQSRDFNRTINIHVTGDIAGRAIALVERRTEEEN